MTNDHQPVSAIAGNRTPLFQPITINSLTLPNRIVMSAMGQGHAVDGVPDARYPSYYRRRAEGGAGLIIGGATAIPHSNAAMDTSEPHFHGSAALAVWKQSIEQVHAAGGRMIPQLWHSGMHGVAMKPPPWPMIGPSGVWMSAPGPDGSAGSEELRGQPMSQGDIDAVIAAFGDAVAMARELGFDGVELHGAHGFLIDQFLWSRTNRRSDGYGGDVRGRTRFAVEVLQECRRRVGPDFPILMRVSQFKMTDYSARLAQTPQELGDILQPLAEAGVDAFDCSIRRFAEPTFAGSALNLAGWARKLTGKPSICCGGIGLAADAVDFGTAGAYGKTASPSTAQLDQVCEMLARGDFDMIALARAILGDAAWANKVRDGREAELTPFTADRMMSLD
jgi:2,4-dienoyl-CoA reductase-like NADH-dependent reductase (Old Yellow Enzyme family)